MKSRSSEVVLEGEMNRNLKTLFDQVGFRRNADSVQMSYMEMLV